MFSAFDPSKCTHTWSSGQGEQLGVRCLVQGSHLSCGQFLLEPRFKPTTSGYKSDALSIRATTAPNINDPRDSLKFSEICLAKQIEFCRFVDFVDKEVARFVTSRFFGEKKKLL